MNNPLSEVNSVIFPLDYSFQFPEKNFTTRLQYIPEKQDLLLPKTSILEPEEDPTLLLTSKSQQFVEPTEIESQSIPKINKNSNIADKSSDKEIKDVLTGNVQNSSQRLARSGQVDNAGNEFATARDLGTLGKKQIFRDFVGDSDAIDYYRFQVTEKGSVVNLSLKGLSSNADLALYNSNGESIDSSYNQGTTAELINTPLEVGTYYIKVSPDYWSSSNTQYNLTVSSKPDVGNTIKDAYNLGVLKEKKNLTDFVVGEWYDKSDPADYYRFQIKKWSNVKLAVTGLENEANVELLSGSGALIKSLDSVGDSAQTITETLKPGSYYIKADTNWTQAKYNIELSSSAASENPASISNLSFSGKEGDKGTFEIQLKQKPKSDITLKFINGKYLTVDADNDVLTGTQDTITFTPANWNKPRKASFIAEVDGVKSNRNSGNTIDYSISGSMKGGGTYNLGTIVNTYAPDNQNFNIDLDFRNDYLNFWTPEKQKIAQQAADDWARLIDNEHKNSYLANQEIFPPTTEQTNPFKVNRFVDDLVIFVNAYGKDDGWAGWGGPSNGYSQSEPLSTYGGVSINSNSYNTGNKGQDNSGIYNVVAHEIGHVLGLVGLNYTSGKLIKENEFTGAYSRALNGGKNIPLQSGGAHPKDMKSIMSYSYFGSTVTAFDKRLLADTGYKVYGINAQGKPGEMSEFGQLLESSEKDDTLETARRIGTLNSNKRTFNEFVGAVDFGDYYRFSVGGKGGTLNLNLDGLSSNAEVTLLNSKEEWVNGSYKPSNLAESITTFLEPGTYYVDIWSPQGAEDTNYKLSLQLTSTFAKPTLTGTTAINGTGNNQANIINGNTANNILNGSAGNNSIQGNGGVDKLLGSDGNDSLNGGAGNDTLTGGIGVDKFIYNTNAAFTTTAVGVDTITDFDISQTDQIVLDKTTFTSISSAPGTGFSVASEFAKVTTDALAATRAADIVYNSTTGGLFYNQNGTVAGFGTGAKFLTLTNKPVLTENQFVIQA